VGNNAANSTDPSGLFWREVLDFVRAELEVGMMLVAPAAPNRMGDRIGRGVALQARDQVVHRAGVMSQEWANSNGSLHLFFARLAVRDVRDTVAGVIDLFGNLPQHWRNLIDAVRRNPEEMIGRALALGAEAYLLARILTPGGIVAPNATPINPRGTGRAINIYGKREAVGFANYATEARYANGRPLTTSLRDHVASDLAMRDAPLSPITVAELQRLAQRGARITYANADVDGFATYAQQLRRAFPNGRVVYQGIVSDSRGVQRGVIVLELP
jgi:hypothetical protein